MRRKCGTCRYWEEAGIANSGICTHPQRSDLRDVLLVRRNELACRNPWDDDLWQPRPGLETETADEHDEADRDGHAIVDVPQPAAPLENPTDRVTDVAVRRRVGPMPRPHGWPYSAQHQSDHLGEQSHDQDARQTPFRVGVDDVAAWLDEADDTNPVRRTIDFARHGSSGTQSGSWSPSDHSYTEQLSPITGGSQAAEVEPSLDMPPTFLQPTDPLPDIKQMVDDYSEAPTEPSPSVLTDNATFEIHQQPPTFTPEPVSRPSASKKRERPPAQATDPIDSVPWAASIPRCCETCRDFRRNQDGATGVCTNPWAFADRTNAVVKSDQLACRSSIGVWWLPNDDAWRGKFDTEERTRPTPRLDELLRDRDKKRY